MNPATRYQLVTLLHLAADIVFVGGLLAALLLLAALSLQSAAAVARERRVVAAVQRWHERVTGSALLVAWACGIALAVQAGWFAMGWLHVKLALVLALSALHGVVSRALRRVGAEAAPVPARAWRIVPLVSAVAVAAIVWLALLKPF